MQFHPEVDLSVNGMAMLRNFVVDVCRCSATYTVENREVACIREIQEQAGDKKVCTSLEPTEIVTKLLETKHISLSPCLSLCLPLPLSTSVSVCLFVCTLWWMCAGAAQRARWRKGGGVHQGDSGAGRWQRSVYPSLESLGVKYEASPNIYLSLPPLLSPCLSLSHSSPLFLSRSRSPLLSLSLSLSVYMSLLCCGCVPVQRIVHGGEQGGGVPQGDSGAGRRQEGLYLSHLSLWR